MYFQCNRQLFLGNYPEILPKREVGGCHKTKKPNKKNTNEKEHLQDKCLILSNMKSQDKLSSKSLSRATYPALIPMEQHVLVWANWEDQQSLSARYWDRLQCFAHEPFVNSSRATQTSQFANLPHLAPTLQ